VVRWAGLDSAQGGGVLSLFHLTETSAAQALVGGDDGKGSFILPRPESLHRAGRRAGLDRGARGDRFGLVGAVLDKDVEPC